jgi:hypothetical protein
VQRAFSEVFVITDSEPEPMKTTGAHFFLNKSACLSAFLMRYCSPQTYSWPVPLRDIPLNVFLRPP